MRIISGDYKGRTIHVPPGLQLRPTTDIAKESLFNILNNRYYFDEISVLDLFSGTGSLTYEFLSHGSRDITCVDVNPRHVSFISQTCKMLGHADIHVVRIDAFQFLRTCSRTFNIIFADPPYDLKGIDRIPTLVFAQNLLHADGVLIVEHSLETDLSPLPCFIEKRKWGKVNMSFFGRS